MKSKSLIAMTFSLSLSAGALAVLPLAAWPSALAALAEIIVMVSSIAVATSILEYRCYLRYLNGLALPLTRFARLPERGSHAFLASFASGSVAAMMLAESFKAGELSRREMILAALCTTVPPVFLFNCYLTLPVIGMLGYAGGLYFLISLGILLTAQLIFLVAARLGLRDSAPASAALPEPCPWPETWRKTRRQTGKFLTRLLFLTTPFYLWTAAALKYGWLDFRLPASVEAVVSPEVMAVVAARVGGLLAASGSAAELLRQHAISPLQLVLALLAGNVLNGLTRLLRRGLPVSFGIYPGYDGALIAGIGAGVRILLTAAAAATIWRMAF